MASLSSCTVHMTLCGFCLALAQINPLFTGRCFHCYMLDESICHLRGVKLTLSLYSIFDEKSC